MDYLEQVQEAVEKSHGCRAKHLATERVEEVFQGQTAWRGRVETFGIEGHQETGICYAWGYKEDGRFKAVTVLRIPPVTSPQTAVKAVIVNEARKRT